MFDELCTHVGAIDAFECSVLILKDTFAASAPLLYVVMFLMILWINRPT